MDRSLISLVFVTAGFLWAAAARTPADDDLYLGLNHERLFAALGVQEERQGVRGVFSGSLSTRPLYLLRTFYVVGPNGPKFERFAIGVFPSVEKAVRGSRGWNAAQIRNAPALPAGRTAPGDHFEWQRSSEGMGVYVRWKNLVLVIDLSQRPACPEEALDLAWRLDALIRDDRQIAPLGRFDPPPEIVSVGIPDTLPVRLRVPWVSGGFREVPEESRYRFTPEIRGLGDPARLRVRIGDLERNTWEWWNEVTPDGRSEPRIDVTVPWPFEPPMNFGVGSRERTPEEDGRFMLKLAWEPGPRRLVMVVVNDDNVVVAKEFQVTFTPR